MQNTNSINNANERAFVFYPSFARSLDLLPSNVQLEVYRAISHYGCLSSLPQNLSPMAMAMFELIKPQIDATTSRYEKASRGGAPKGSSNNPNGRRGKKAVTESSQTEELTQELTSELTETNSETNLETNNKLNNEAKEEVEIEEVNDEIEYDCSRNYERARKEFLDDFFSNERQQAISKQLKTLGISHIEYQYLVERVLDDWELNGPIPKADNNLRSRMLCTVRKKYLAYQQSTRRQSTGTSTWHTDTGKPVHNNDYYDSIEASNRQREEAYNSPYLSGEALNRKLAALNLEDENHGYPRREIRITPVIG